MLKPAEAQHEGRVHECEVHTKVRLTMCTYVSHMSNMSVQYRYHVSYTYLTMKVHLLYFEKIDKIPVHVIKKNILLLFYYFKNIFL